jgi:hypothetical protein
MKDGEGESEEGKCKNMKKCKDIGIHWKEEEELYKQFIQAKGHHDSQRRERGEKETSCAEFTKILLHKALKEEGEESEEGEGEAEGEEGGKK